MWSASSSLGSQVGLNYLLCLIHFKFRSKDFFSDMQWSDAQSFMLYAFVNDVDQDVTEGSDGIEHMYI